MVGEQEVPAALLQRGDVLKVLPGARLPADGEVTAGRSHVDESMITGKALEGGGPREACASCAPGEQCPCSGRVLPQL